MDHTGASAEASRVGTDELRALFAPRSIAVVGASPNNANARRMLQNLTALEYEGVVVAVNPQYDSVAGFPCYPSLSAIPEPPEAIAVAVAPERVEAVLEEAERVGVRAAVVFSDLRGTADEGLQHRIGERFRGSSLTVFGPNCQGVVSFVDRAALYLLEVGPYRPGHLGLIAQSGAVLEMIATNRRGARWSHLVSTGNELFVDASAALEYLLEQPECHGVCLFLEGIRDAERFFALCERARDLGKPIIVLRAGRTSTAQAVAATHTGAVAMPDRLIEARFARHGVISVRSIEELLATAVVVQSRRRPARARTAVIAGSGGLLELFVDAAEAAGVELAELGPDTTQELQAVLERDEPQQNPLDIWPLKDFDVTYPRILDAVARDDAVDVVVAISHFDWFPTSGLSNTNLGVNAVRNFSARTGKQLVILDPVEGAAPQDVIVAALPEDVLVLSGIDSSLRALRNAAVAAQPRRPAAAGAPLDGAVDAALAALGPGATSGPPALDVMAAAGMSVARSAVATSADEAAERSTSLRFPLVMKSGDPENLHKTEHGGVLLGLGDPEEVRKAAEALLAAGNRQLLLQEQLEGGVEMILGIQNDPSLGPFVVVGAGGIWTEYLDDVVLRPAGLREGEAEEMVASLRTAPLLHGARGRAPADVASLVDAIGRLDALATTHRDRIASVDINPVIVTPTGAHLVDAVVALRQAAT